MKTNEVRTRRIRANGLDFAVREAGEGPLVLCLHGFPDYAGTWSGLMARLAEAGFHAVAPTMRGYGLTGPAPDGCYQDWATGGDVVALLQALGDGKGVVIGHDWGAAAAYAAAALAPDRVERLVTMAVPYGMRNTLLVDGDQQRRSWYWFFFQMPFAAAAVAYNDFAFIDRLWREWSPNYVLPAADRSAIKAMFAEPGVLGEALSYYRQLFTDKPEWNAMTAKLGGPISAPALYFHGVDDGCIGAYLSEGMEAHFPNGLRRMIVENAGHFVHLEQPALIEDEIVRFLKAEVSR